MSERALSEQSLQVGDVVELKSGGPAMTITSIYDSTAECRWFIGTGGVLEHEVPMRCLEKTLPRVHDGTAPSVRTRASLLPDAHFRTDLSKGGGAR